AKHIVTHVPSGLKAQERPTVGEAKEIVQGFVHSGIDTASKGLASDKETLKKLAGVVKALNGDPAPDWFRSPAPSPQNPVQNPAPAVAAEQ
ncbi:hypothetical protein, partial [Caballeronia sp. ASUFL_F2_KS49]|uniref:hypothetical protein n=1 Tax=Caballeronia sp. ASUFL_F2_KS49 TaxID=2921773 RepID=UPI002027CCF1